LTNFFEEFLIILGASLIACLLFGRLKLPTIVAYMIAGAVIGPHAIGLVEEPEHFSFLAEFGVVFLLFSLGLEFSLSRLIQIKKIVFGLGFSQVAACVLVFAGVVYIWGCSLEASIIIAGALALSSTAIVTRELGEYRQMNKRYAQLSIGVLLFQDLIALVFLILVPVLAAAQETSLGDSLLSALWRGALLLAILMSVGHWFLPFIYGEISKTRSQEVFVLGTLVIGLMAAWLTHELHLSMTLGGFIIGMMLGESDFKHQIEIDLRPFKDILLGLFFVTMGMSIEIELLVEYWPRLLLFTFALISIKMGIVAMVVNIMGDTKRNALRTGITLSQAGEFGLALLALSNKSGIVPEEQASFMVILALLSMAASAVLIRKNEVVTDWLLPLLPMTGTENGKEDEQAQIEMHENDHVIIGGFGRVGQTIALVLEENKIPYIAIENDPGRVKTFRRKGVNIIYGDCNNTDFLQSCHIDSARLAILTFRFHELALHTLKRIRNSEWKTPVILRCHEEGQLEELVSLGASHVVPEMLETRLLIANQVLNLLQISPDLIEEQIDQIRKES
jgi:CPA2 family monovalent cation:H+ antiporter-2